MSQTGEQDPLETGWPEEGGRSFARGTWRELGPFNYSNRRPALRVATKAIVWIVLAWIVVTGIFIAYQLLLRS